MSGQNPPLKSSEVRKQLLIAESEMQRTLLLDETRALLQDADELILKAGQILKTASSAAAAVSAFTHFRGEPEDGGKKRPFLRTLMSGLRLGTSIWMAFKKGKE